VGRTVQGNLWPSTIRTRRSSDAMVLGPIISGGGRAFFPLGVTVAKIAAQRILGGAAGLLGRSNLSRVVTGGLAVAGAAELAGQVIDVFQGGGPLAQPGTIPFPARAPARRPADIVVGGQGPVTFVKMWRAGEAIFAIDSEGKRWAFRPKLGIWKRTRVFTNIVISRKDVFRARRLIRTSKRLNAIRKGLR